MRFGIVTTVAAIVLLVHAAAPTRATAQDRSRGAARTDQTVDVTRGTRLRLEGLSGAATVRAWDKDAVRVQARHASATRVSVRNVKAVVSVQSDSTSGPPGGVDYEINVPRWMPVSVEVTFDDITIEGTESDVSAETVRGNITIKGGAGSVRAESVEGKVLVEGVRGRVDVSSVNDLIRIDGAAGEISADTTNGSVTLTRIQASMVKATTVNGNISYDGAIADVGHYSLATHNGDILVSIPEQSNVTFEVRTYNGSFNPDLPVKGVPPARRGGHGLYTLGNGSARMELESFGGSIRVRDARAAGRSGKRHEQ
jgi:DUF4097 and DUF4098 domain-containing protein YvlB